MEKIFIEDMKEFVTDTADTCWKDSLACILEINPEDVPNFVKRYKIRYLDKTREWLEKKFKKGMVYVPSKNFMEAGEAKNNPPVGPSGYSIGLLSMVDDRANHAVVCYNGKVCWDNGDERAQEYDVMMGYYVVYDLEIKKSIIKSKKKKEAPPQEQAA